MSDRVHFSDPNGDRNGVLIGVMTVLTARWYCGKLRDYIATLSAMEGEGQLLVSNNYNDTDNFLIIKVVWGAGWKWGYLIL